MSVVSALYVFVMRGRCQVPLTFGKQMQRNFVVYLRGIFALGVTFGVNQAELKVADWIILSRVSNRY